MLLVVSAPPHIDPTLVLSLKVDMRGKYKFAIPDDFRTVLPVVIVRDPYFWMESKLHLFLFYAKALWQRLSRLLLLFHSQRLAALLVARCTWSCPLRYRDFTIVGE
jgi:hypothetical protein